MANKYKTFLFDFDYTLVDSSDGIVQSFIYAFRDINIVPPLAYDIKKTIGLSLQEAYFCLVGKKASQLSENFRASFIKHSKKFMLTNSKLYDDVPNVLKTLKDKGYNIGIVSSKDSVTIQNLLNYHGIDKFIDVIVGEESVVHPKPDAEPLNNAMSLLGAKRQEVLYVGDSTTDALAALNANVDFVAVLTGVTSRNAFCEYPFVCVIRRLSELLEFFHYCKM